MWESKTRKLEFIKLSALYLKRNKYLLNIDTKNYFEYY